MSRSRTLTFFLAAALAWPAGTAAADPPPGQREAAAAGGDPSPPQAGRAVLLQRIAAGQEVEGRLDGDSQLLADGSAFQAYLYQGRAGEEIVVTLESADFEPVLAGGALRGGVFRAEEQAATLPGEGVVRLNAVTGADGTYGVWANARHAGGGGRYRLTVHLAPGARPPAVPRQSMEAIDPDATLERVLDDESPSLADGSRFHLFVYTGEPGDRLLVTLRSDDFGTFLSWGVLRGGAFHAETSDSLGAGGTVSRLGVTVGAGGRSAIRVNALRPSGLGAYSLSVELVEPAPFSLAAAGDEATAPLVASGREWAAGEAAGRAVELPGCAPAKAFPPILVHDPGVKPVR
jgi:hypothetical protein